MDWKPVQRALIALGYDLGKTGADGIPGRLTINAVTDFQHRRALPIRYPGTVGPTTLKALGLDPSVPVEMPWIGEARRWVGLREKADNAALRAKLKSDGATVGDPAKIPWCGDFVQTPLALTLPKEALPTNPYWALNWAKFGRDTGGLFIYGSVGVKKRKGGGHVFYIIGHDKTHVHALGGNQGDMVSVVRIPKTQIEAMRFPLTYDMPTVDMPMTVFNGEFGGKED